MQLSLPHFLLLYKAVSKNLKVQLCIDFHIVNIPLKYILFSLSFPTTYILFAFALCKITLLRLSPSSVSPASVISSSSASNLTSLYSTSLVPSYYILFGIPSNFPDIDYKS